MYKLNGDLKVRIRSILPNYITLLCGIILITTISGKIYLEYLIPLFALFYFLIVKRGTVQGSAGKDIFILFGTFITIQAAGLLQNITIYSIKNILTSASVFVIVYTILAGEVLVQPGYIKIFYIVICIALTGLSGVDAGSKNAIAGNAVFLYLLLIVLLAGNEYTSKKRRRKKAGFRLYSVVIGMLPGVVFSFLYSARTALLVSIALILFYFIFYYINLKTRTYWKLFSVMVVFIVVGLSFYINIKSFSWYLELNELSLQYFGKNIDSSRSYLWQTSLAELKGLDWIWGLGTGITPFIPRYFNSSFHNSFIQTLMQNGIIALLCLIFIFWILWKHIVQIKERRLRALFMSAFIAVVAYNCMECCLLQNKSFLGMIQWIILSLGVYYANT